MSTRFSAATIVVVASMLGLPLPGSGQVGLPLGGDGPSLQLEISKPFFDDGGDLGLLTAILDATVVVPTGRATLFGRLGLSVATRGGRAGSTLSNPRIGALVGSRGGTHAEVHLDLPVGREFGHDGSELATTTFVAYFADFERFERFVTDAWSFGISVTAEKVAAGNLLGARLGANYVMPTGLGDAQPMGLYAAFGNVPAGSASIGAEISGVAILSEPGLSLSERMMTYFTAQVELPQADRRPAFYARVPLYGELTGFLDLVLGLRLLMGG